MSTFVILSVFFTVAFICCAVVAVFSAGSNRYDLMTPFILSYFITFIVLNVGIFINVQREQPDSNKTEWQEEQVIKYDLKPFSEMDIERDGIDNPDDTYVFFYDHRKDRIYDRYYMVLNEIGSDISHRFVYVERENAVVNSVAEGDSPHVVIHKTPGMVNSLFDLEYSVIKYEYEIYVDQDQMVVEDYNIGNYVQHTERLEE